VGYGNGLYSAGANFNSFLALAEVGYRYSPLGRVVAKYTHDFSDSINANYFSDHALTASIDQQLGPIVMHASVGGRLRAYRGISPVLGPDPSRDDVIIEVLVRGRYFLRERLALTAQYQLLVDQTDYRYQPEGSAGPDDPGFVRHEALLGALAAF
jgi:hypothetical protein